MRYKPTKIDFRRVREEKSSSGSIMRNWSSALSMNEKVGSRSDLDIKSSEVDLEANLAQKNTRSSPKIVKSVDVKKLLESDIKIVD